MATQLTYRTGNDRQISRDALKQEKTLEDPGSDVRG